MFGSVIYQRIIHDSSYDSVFFHRPKPLKPFNIYREMLVGVSQVTNSQLWYLIIFYVFIRYINKLYILNLFPCSHAKYNFMEVFHK